MPTIFDELLQAFRSLLSHFDPDLIRDAVARIDWAMPPRDLAPRPLPCIAHLDRARVIAPDFAKPLVSLLGDHRTMLHWGQTYTDAEMGKDFIDNYGWLELFGSRGHFRNDATAAGLLILGPNVAYPDHHHLAEEIYIPLTGGTAWRMGEGAFVSRGAGEVIHHASNMNHAMHTGAEPLLALYIWRNGPLAAKSTVTGGLAHA